MNNRVTSNYSARVRLRGRKNKITENYVKHMLQMALLFANLCRLRCGLAIGEMIVEAEYQAAAPPR